MTKDKENENNILEIFTFGEERNENNYDNKKNGVSNNLNLNKQSRNKKQKENVPNNSKIKDRNISMNNSNNNIKNNKMTVNEDSNKNSFDFRKNILQKMSYIHNIKKKN